MLGVACPAWSVASGMARRVGGDYVLTDHTMTVRHATAAPFAIVILRCIPGLHSPQAKWQPRTAALFSVMRAVEIAKRPKLNFTREAVLPKARRAV